MIQRLLLLLVVLAARPSSAAVEISVRDHGALGDGQALDTAAINRAIQACAGAGGGRVVFTPGTYLSGTVRLPKGETSG